MPGGAIGAGDGKRRSPSANGSGDRPAATLPRSVFRAARSMPPTVHNLGSVNIDHVYRVPHLVRPGETLSSRALETVLGGKGANQSVALARAGARVRHVGRVGEGDAWARDALAGDGVDVSAVELVEGVSGHAIIQVDEEGENAIVLHGGANRTLDAGAIERALADAREGDWLLMQNETSGVASAFEVARRLGLRIAFNPAPMSAAVGELPLERCELLILNETEAAMLAGEAGRGGDEADVERALLERCPGVRLVLTLGARGARFLHGDTRVEVAGRAVEAVDTTGAGDTFVGYLLAALVEGAEERAAVERACAAAALSVTVSGATPSIPGADAVADALASVPSANADASDGG